jgi:hypothetical protein
MEATLVLAGLRLNTGEIDALRGRLPTMNFTTQSSSRVTCGEWGLAASPFAALSDHLLADWRTAQEQPAPPGPPSWPVTRLK